jgi:hypothetical protein
VKYIIDCGLAATRARRFLLNPGIAMAAEFDTQYTLCYV